MKSLIFSKWLNGIYAIRKNDTKTFRLMLTYSDEVHRSQYGVYAENIERLLPTASRIGLTDRLETYQRAIYEHVYTHGSIRKRERLMPEPENIMAGGGRS